MKTNEKLKTTKTEEAFSAVVIIVLLLILPEFGATAMLAGSALALCGYTLLFKDNMRDRCGSLRPAIYVTISLALAALVAFVVSLAQGRRY